MNKLAALFSVSALALVSSVALAAPSAPAGFGNSSPAANQAAPAGSIGFSQPSNKNLSTVQQVIQNGMDDQYVTLTGKLTNYLGQDNYEFSDATGTIVVELDDERNWSHIGKDQLITIYAEVDREPTRVELSVKEAVVAK